MWQCPHCSERHEDQFETCWKCGTTREGARDHEFQVSESGDAERRAPVSPVLEAELPSLELPAFTYFAIPPFILATLAGTFLSFPPRRSPAGMVEYSAWEIAFAVLGSVLIGIPAFFTMARFMLFNLLRRRKRQGHRDFFWLPRMFVLPAPLRARCRWFGSIYYGSLLALPVGYLAIFLWLCWHM